MYVDRYGNVHTNVAPEQVAQFGDKLKFASNAKTQQIPIVRTFGDVNEHEPALVIDDVGLMSVIVNQGSASQLFQLHNGDTFTIS